MCTPIKPSSTWAQGKFMDRYLYIKRIWISLLRGGIFNYSANNPDIFYDKIIFPPSVINYPINIHLVADDLDGKSGDQRAEHLFFVLH